MARRHLLVLAAATLIALWPSRDACAQRLIATTPFGIAPTVFSASGSHLVGLTSQSLLPDDQDALEDVYVFTIADVQVRRVTRVVLAGLPPVQADGMRFELLSVSGDGRYLAYLMWRPATPSQPSTPVLARMDLTTESRVVIRDALFDPFSSPVMSRDGSTFAWVGAADAVLVGTVGQPPVAVGQTCPVSRPGCEGRVALTADGRRVFYTVGAPASAPQPWGLEAVTAFDRDTASTETYPELGGTMAATLTVTGSGGHVLVASSAQRWVLDTASRRVESIENTPLASPGISDDGRTVLGASFSVYDRQFSAVLQIAVGSVRALSADGRYVAGLQWDGVGLVLDLDGDGDGMSDPWETVFGLDPGEGADGSADPDGDGRSNLREFQEGTHPKGLYRRVFAEGITTGDFQTRVQVLEAGVSPVPPASRAGPIVISFLGDDGSRGGRIVGGIAGRRLVGGFGPSDLLTTGQYSILVEGELPFAAERITTWGPAQALRGAHGSSGSTASTTWHFAEGATTGQFQLFFLMANPGDVPAVVDAAYQLASGQVVHRQYGVPPRSRVTVWVNQEGGLLASAELSTSLTSSVPIVAERAMYVAGPDGLGPGTAAMGAHAPSTTWRFAEGATLDPFDTFFLLHNPSDSPATVQAVFGLENGQRVEHTYDVPARTRRTVWANQEPGLASTTFSTTLQSTVGIVAERAMWWRGAGPQWREGHAELGATSTAGTWVIADVPESAFLLIANTAPTPTTVHIRVFATSGVGAGETVVTLPPESRTTFWPVQAFPNLPPGQYSARIEPADQNGPPAALVVERASYAPGLGAGSVYLGTPIEP